MTGKAKIAAILLTLTAVVYGFIPLLADLSPTHVLHPAWTAHARFHVVWQISIGTLIALIVLYLLWGPGEGRLQRLRLAAVLGCAVLGGFVVASLTRDMYGGGFTEPGGVPPVGGIDANVLAFTPTIIIQLIALWLAFAAPREQAK